MKQVYGGQGDRVLSNIRDNLREMDETGDYTLKNNKFSFNDFIMNNLKNLKVGSLLFDELFIDIGTPEDYDRAHLILDNY